MTPHKPKIFVISPIGPGDSQVREQADLVLAILKQAAADYDVVRADEQDGTKITDTMLKSLATSRVVIAYLGIDAFNPNVMFEIGYRWATGKPILLIGHEGTKPSFDLHDTRYLPIPKWEDLKKANAVAIAAIAEEIRNHILKVDKARIWSPYAAAEILVDLTPRTSPEERVSNSIFTLASESAEKLFNKASGLMGWPIQTVLEGLEAHVVEDQWQAFHEEQSILLGRLLAGNTDIRAKVPFIFKEDDDVDEEVRGRAFLALIFNHNFHEQALALHLLYYDVSTRLRKCEDGHLVFDQDAPPVFQEQLN